MARQKPCGQFLRWQDAGHVKDKRDETWPAYPLRVLVSLITTMRCVDDSRAVVTTSVANSCLYRSPAHR